MGRAWYEMVDYVQAKAAFEKARKRDPQRLEVISQAYSLTHPFSLRYEESATGLTIRQTDVGVIGEA